MAFRWFEWTIVNFSCWNREVLGYSITSPTFSCSGFNRRLQLFRDNVETLEVWLIGNKIPYKYDGYSGELSFISSNGSVIFTKEIMWHMQNTGRLISSELKFRDLVAQIRENEADHQDRLTVRLRGKNVSSDNIEYIRTTIEVHKISVKIPSEKFNQMIEGKPVQVIRFPLTDDDDDSVQIGLHESDNAYSFVLEIFSKSMKKILISIRTSVLNKDDAVLKMFEDEHVFFNNEKKTLNSLTKEEVKEKDCSLLINLKIIPPENCKYRGHFYVNKDIHVALPNSLKSGSFSFVSLEKPSNNPKIVTSSDRTDDDPVAVLTKELMCVFQDHDFSDLLLKCGGVSLPVHKVILSARSPVFKRLLSSDMREAASGSVDIEDLDAPTLTRFLAFLYTGSVEDLDGDTDTAIKLYYAADKYQVPSLKSECVSVLSEGVAVSNVCDILSLADRHQDDQLTSLAQDFYLRNYNEVLGSSEWESFMNRESLLAVKTLTAIAREKSVGKTSS